MLQSGDWSAQDKEKTQARCLCYCRQDWRVAKKTQARSQSSGGTSPTGQVPVLDQFSRQLSSCLKNYSFFLSV
jgi:hypothetical protein